MELLKNNVLNSGDGDGDGDGDGNGNGGTDDVNSKDESGEINKYDIKNFTFNSWDDDNIDFKNQLLRGIYSYGFNNPSNIQKQSIIPMVMGKDVIAQAHSGTGKTGAFSISALQLVDESINTTQIIIMSPTRELSTQNYNVCRSIGNSLNVTIQLLIGGTSTEKDKMLLTNNIPHIVIGCPGRIHALIRSGNLKTNNIRTLILDEADEMLSSGFKDQVYNIFQYLNNDTQVGLFSATLPIELNSLTEKFMRNPIKILVKKEMLTLEGIKQYKLNVNDDHQKYETLKDIFSTIAVSQCIIYCNSIKRVQDLTDAMIQDQFPVISIHSSMDEDTRKSNFNSFKTGKSRVLISSNITARGIDIQQVSVVINFDIPKCKHTYIHRIGRGGRWGRRGIAINFITRRDILKLNEIEQFYNTQIDDLPTNFGDFARNAI
jgi:translation initiation factor 4A